MYGYVRPVKGELKVSEYERFRGVYCGLCHELAHRYGFCSRFLVNYDLTFLAMLLARRGEGRTCPRRCPSHPLRATVCLADSESLALAADVSVVLGWWKLRDGAQDGGFFPSVGCKCAGAALKGAYKKAAARRPALAAAVQNQLEALRLLEQENCESLDAPADKFAAILRAIGQEQPGDAGRILGELLYHLGRIIYLLDAVDDLPEDVRTGSYNPLCRRFSLADWKLSPEDEKTLRAGLQLSHNALAGAYALLEENEYAGILSNIIYLGLPAATQAVFDGTWKPSARLHRERSSI